MKQVLADLALSPIANRYVEDLTQSEYRRLTIGVSNWYKKMIDLKEDFLDLSLSLLSISVPKIILKTKTGSFWAQFDKIFLSNFNWNRHIS